ncbi:MAG: hypothetical protein CMD25_00745 [Flavobacteriales bacterium]|nr:hypothetical protein [Flavobacteriales bacterium]|tara:strand:- start:302 stop:754 length:453 start_codon:yes stop_codon:yes gene_type:complete
MKVPKKPSGRRAMPFYWWRRFKSHKNLPYKARLLDKITNGDFDPTPFFQEAEWELHWMKEEQDDFKDNYKGNLDEIEQDIRYLEIELRARKRYNKLYEDGMKDEADRMDRLVNNFSKHFKVNRSKMHDIVYSFDGTILELYRFMQKDLVT